MNQLNFPPTPREREIFCNRTLNLRSIKAIGYDMDYTLVHYHVAVWERRAYEYLQNTLVERGWPVGHLRFDADSVIRGLVIDVELGNLLKADRFGYVKQAHHGTKRLDFGRQKRVYARTLVDLGSPRFVFLNTFFSLSEACMYCQLVDLLDENQLPDVLGYVDLYRSVRSALDAAHTEGQLKAEIIANPAEFVEVDPTIPECLYTQKLAGKKLLLITNSEFAFARDMMTWAFDRFLPGDMRWPDLFDLTVCAARKPTFFVDRSPFFEVVDPEQALLKSTSGSLHEGGTYVGGNASEVEELLGVSGSEILYVGDHLYTDVRVTKDILRWRSALVMREIEPEVAALASFEDSQAQFTRLMSNKTRLEANISHVRMEIQHHKRGAAPASSSTRKELEVAFREIRDSLVHLDEQIAPLARAAGRLHNETWGLLMRTGQDKSLWARQVERYADVYTSRVSNLGLTTPYTYLRPQRTNLPHDV